MGEIIAIRAQKRRSPVASSGGAEILFFTGVRYQRAIEEEPSSAAEPRSPQPNGGVGGGRRRRRG